MVNVYVYPTMASSSPKNHKTICSKPTASQSRLTRSLSVNDSRCNERNGDILARAMRRRETAQGYRSSNARCSQVCRGIWVSKQLLTLAVGFAWQIVSQNCTSVTKKSWLIQVISLMFGGVERRRTGEELKRRSDLLALDGRRDRGAGGRCVEATKEPVTVVSIDLDANVGRRKL